MPRATLITRFKTASAQRKASGMLMRRLAESSSVRSSHWVAAVTAVFCTSQIRYRASEQIRSERIGLRL